MNNQDLIKKYLPENKWNEALKKLNENIPVQYIIGSVDFYGREFIVNENVLIPRFETETLVEKTIKYIKKYDFENIKIADLASGTGCIGITLEQELHANVTCFEISDEAIKVSLKNAKNLSSNVKILKHDITNKPSGKFNIIISNPPYIDKNEKIDELVYNNEPHLALFADDSGLYFYKKIINYAKYILENKFIIAFEIGCTQGEKLKQIAKEEFSTSVVTVEKDLCGKNRYLFIINE